MKIAFTTKCGILIAFCFLSISMYAQTSKEKNERMHTQIIKYFNEKNGDSLYALTSPTFQKKVSETTFMNLFTKQLLPLGNIQVATLIKYDDGAAASIYKVDFERIVLTMIIALDSNEKLETFVFKPYKEEKPQKASVEGNNKLQSLLDRQIDTAAKKYILQRNTVGLSIGVLTNGNRYTYGYGEVIKGNGNIPNASTLFEIGSITKTFTSLLLAHFVVEGKVKLSDAITKYLPDSVANNEDLKGITLEMLSNHTSGLPRMPENAFNETTIQDNPYKNYDINMLYAYLKNFKRTSAPGSYDYSNLGAALLGVILEKVSGKEYEELVKKYITEPLRMSNTVEHLNSKQDKIMGRVYTEEGEETPVWDFDIMAPAGALKSNVNDMLEYANVLINIPNTSLGKAIKLAQKITYTNETISLGLGWHISKMNNLPFYWHNGGTYGSSSFIAYIPEKKIAVVVLANSAESVDEVGIEVLSVLSGMK